MIDKEATIKKFGYNPDNLKPQSSKKGCCVCDECGKVRYLRKRGHGDLCSFCAGKNLGLRNKGRIHSEEHKKKVSKSLEGNQRAKGKHWKMSEEDRKSISERVKGKNHPMYGKITPQKVREKISKSLKGKHAGKNNPMYGKKGKENPMYGREGKESPTWKGGISFEPYCPKFTKKIKEEVREQYGRKCLICGKSEEENSRKLCIHHVDYNKDQGCKGNIWKLVPLCSSCHSKTNHDRNYWEKTLKEMMI